MLIVLILTFLNSALLFAQVSLQGGVISVRCQELFEERGEKISYQQKLQSLIQREQKLLKNLPETRKSTSLQLQSLHRRLRNEHYLASLEIRTMEEDIIRSGCPGLSLE